EGGDRGGGAGGTGWGWAQASFFPDRRQAGGCLGGPRVEAEGSGAASQVCSCCREKERLSWEYPAWACSGARDRSLCTGCTVRPRLTHPSSRKLSPCTASAEIWLSRTACPDLLSWPGSTSSSSRSDSGRVLGDGLSGWKSVVWEEEKAGDGQADLTLKAGELSWAFRRNTRIYGCPRDEPVQYLLSDPVFRRGSVCGT
ncbi:hypothetical protein ANANG_G00054160, partial [Anguilla anguilla]